MTPQEMQERRNDLRARWASLTEAERDEYTRLTKTLADQDFHVLNGELVPAAESRRQARYAGKRQN